MDFKMIMFQLAVGRATAKGPQLTYKGTPVYVSDDVCQNMCLNNVVPFVGVCGVQFSNQAQGKITHCIFCNNKFMELPEDVRAPVFEHELGHVVHKHSDKNNTPTLWEVFGFKGKYLQQEMEADAYAAAIVGKDAVIKALKTVVKDYPFFSRLLMQHRYKALNKL